jgi:hypothetical protein
MDMAVDEPRHKDRSREVVDRAPTLGHEVGPDTSDATVCVDRDCAFTEDVVTTRDDGARAHERCFRHP